MRIRVNAFRGILNIPNWAAERQGFFQARGLEVDVSFTNSSEDQRRDLANGSCDLAHSAVDNALALVDAGIEAVIVIGLDSGFNKFVVRSDIESWAQLRGKRFGVDAPDTAFALLGYEVLRREGLERGRDYEVRQVGATGFRLQALKDGEIDFALLNLPFNLLAQEAGFRILADPLDAIGPYQSTGAFVLRQWAEGNVEVLEQYLSGYINGLQWAMDPGNRDEVVTMLMERLSLSRDIAEACHAEACSADRGFSPYARIDRAGLAHVVTLRDAFSPKPAGVRRVPETYVDASFHDRVMKRLQPHDPEPRLPDAGS